jgi:glyoxylase-like metal-dependent hydrolase (beta-lactamase superfamily II)
VLGKAAIRMTLITLEPGLRRLRAANPSPLTGTGTNTYIVGMTDLAVIDPGPDLPDHLDAILRAIEPHQRLQQIIVTHAHKDHSALAPVLAAWTGAEVLAFGTALDGRSPLMQRLADALPSEGEGLDLAFRPDRRLGDGDTVSGPDWMLSAIHTPGHLGGHLCLALGPILFSGDHVMGWSTSLISPPDGDMGAYMNSLDRLLSGGWHRLLPGHGEPVDDPASRIRDLIRHRRTREAQILAALGAGPARLEPLTAAVYHDIDPRLLPAAGRNALAHLIDLASRNLVTASPSLGPESIFARI